MLAWVYSWVTSLLVQLGLTSQRRTVVFIGLDNAGKTTLLYKLRDGTVQNFVPTQRAQVAEEIKIGRLTLTAIDLGGHDRVRFMWRDYLTKVDAIIFIVDASDRSRIEEAKNELQRIIGETETKNVPLVVLGNKSDLPNAMTQDELIRELRISTDVDAQEVDPSKRPCKLFRSSVLTGVGYEAAFTWLSTVL